MRYKRTIGIEYGHGALRAGEFGRPSPEGLLLPSDPIEAQRMISRYVDETGLAGVPAVLGVPSETVYLSLLKIPSGTRRGREAAVNEHLEGLYALSGSETVSDVSPVPSSGKHKPVLVAVARLDAIQVLISPLQAAGLNILAAVPASLAFFNYAAQKLSSRYDRLVVLCPVSDTGIEALCGVGDTLVGVWRISAGASTQSGNDASMLAFGAELEAAWRGGQAARGEPPSVVWCGDDSLPEDVVKSLSATIGAEPVPVAEWRTDSKAARGTPVLPAALSQCVPGRQGAFLNLLPTAMRERVVRRAKLPYNATAAVLFAAFAIMLCVGESRRSRDVRQRLDIAEAQNLERRELLERRGTLAARNSDYDMQVAALRDSALSPLKTRELLIAIAEAKSPDDLIVCIADARSYFDTPPPVQQQPENGPPPPFTFSTSAFIVEGYTPSADLSSVRSFIETLRMHPQVVAVDLLGDDRVGPDRTPAPSRSIPRIYRFVMEVRTREP